MNDILNTIELDPKVKASVNYAKARIALESVGGSRRELRLAKKIVIDFLGGEVRSINVAALRGDYAREEAEAKKIGDTDRLAVLDKEIRALPKVRTDKFGNPLSVHKVVFNDGSEAKY